MTLSQHLRSNYKSILGVFLLVWLGVFLYIASGNFDSIFDTLFYSALYGAISAIICTVNMIVFFFLFKEWSISHHTGFDIKNIALIALNIITISVANYAFTLYLNGDSTVSFDQYFLMLGLTILIGLLPAIVIYFYDANIALKKKLERVRPINEHLDDDTSNSKVIDWVLKVNDTETHHINIDSLLYAESNRNYVRLFFEHGVETEIRLTLKQLEEKLSGFDFLIRCHRSFIVNMEKVHKASGNAQGYTLDLQNGDVSVQVSRSYLPVIKKWLINHKKAG